MSKLIIKLLIGIIVVVTAGFFIGMPYVNNTLLEKEIDFFKKNKSKVTSISFSSDDFSKLPFVVKNYLRKSIKREAISPQYCKYVITGKTKRDKNSEWENINSQNYYSATTSDFLKIIETQNSFPLWTVTVNKYFNTKASTNSKLLSSITTNDFAGNKLTRSYLVLYLLESVLCPTVLLPNMNVHWKPISSTQALATIWDDNLKGSAIFNFNKKGEITKVESGDRYMPGTIDYNRETFTIHFANYKTFDNFTIPTYFEYQWNLASGDFTFGKFHISEINYK